MKVSFTVKGVPFGKQRPKFARFGTKTMTYTPSKTVNYENYVKEMYIIQTGGYTFPANSMLSIYIRAFYSIPSSESKKRKGLMLKKIIRPTKKPDWDNIGKCICDSLNKIAYDDDKQIYKGTVEKSYSDNPRVEVTIEEYIQGDE